MKSPFGALRLVGGIFAGFGALFLAVAIGGAFTGPGGAGQRGALPVLLSFGFMGAVFAALGAMFLSLGGAGSERRALRLMDEGERYSAEITDVVPAHISVNGHGLWRVVCRYTDESGRQWSCHSAPLWEKPALNGAPAAVYRDPRRPRRYYVDLSAATEDPVGF